MCAGREDVINTASRLDEGMMGVSGRVGGSRGRGVEDVDPFLDP